MATKQDLRDLEARLNGRIDALEAHFDGRFKEVDGRFETLEARLDGRIDSLEARFEGRFRLLYWMIGFNLALTVAVLLKLFLK